MGGYFRGLKTRLGKKTKSGDVRRALIGGGASRREGGEQEIE